MARELAPSELIEGPIQFDAVAEASHMQPAQHAPLPPYPSTTGAVDLRSQGQVQEGVNCGGEGAVCIFPISTGTMRRRCRRRRRQQSGRSCRVADAGE